MGSSTRNALFAGSIVVACLISAASANAQSMPPPAASAAAVTIDGPPPPDAPEVIARDEAGRVTVRATRLETPLRVDGRLDEQVYESVRSFSGLIQNLPDAGKPATENTDVWVFFDDNNVYVSARCWDAAGPNSLIANEMRRDNGQITNNDTFGVIFDTFYDRRNGYMFITNALGAQRDLQVTNEGNSNQDWNPVWNVRADRFDGGWTVEIQIPFKSIRYRPGHDQVWGINVRRGIRRKNEWAHLTALPATDGSGAWIRLSRAATLVGLEVPSGAKNLDIKPYGISGVRTDNTIVPVVTNDVDSNAGFDLKYGLTQNLTLDGTYRTDFAQVEVDEQQINLTRFNLFFPEKREFFLEGRGTFEFGRPNFSRGSVPTGGIVPDLFFSRQIGLNRGRVIPIIAGARLTGKMGRTTIGMLNMQTDDEPVSRTEMTNFTVLRVRQDVLRRSTIGAMYTGRSESLQAPGHANHAEGVDGAFSFYESININGFYMRSHTADADGHEDSYQGRFEYNADRYGLELNHLVVGDAFNPEVGFVQRLDIRRSLASARFSPRVKKVKSIRQLIWNAGIEYVTDVAGSLETREQSADFTIDFHRSDRATASVTRTYDVLDEPFRLPGGPLIAQGSYDYYLVTGGYSFGSQRKVSGNVNVGRGTYYDADQSVVTVGSGRVQLTPQLSLEPSLAINWFTFPTQSLTTRVVRTRVNYTFTPRMFVSALVQYNSSTNSVSTNMRWRWEYTPGSELFVVYTDDNTVELSPGRESQLLSRGIVVKINRLFRF